jgi:hypothetical protein
VLDIHAINASPIAVEALDRIGRIPAEPDHWRPEKADLFWEERRTLIASALNEYLRKKLGSKRMS